MTHEDVVVAVMTWPDEERARRFARRAVEERLAACVQVLPGVRSTYRWEGSLEEADEVRVEIKTSPARLLELERLATETHPYDVPELLVLPVTDGLAAYVHWVRSETADPPGA